MDKWSDKQAVKQKALELWNKGVILKMLLEERNLLKMDLLSKEHPLKIKIDGPKSADIKDDFEKAMLFSSKWFMQSDLEVEYTEISSRLMGHQKVPAYVVFYSIYDFLAFIGKRHEYERLRKALMFMPPYLVSYIRKKPLSYLKYSSIFSKLTLIVNYLIRHPRPGIYLRELSLPSVDTKFIEKHKGILSEILDSVLPPEFIDQNENRSSGFEKRYGFLCKPERIRFRILDPRIKLPFISKECPDVTLDSQSFAGLTIDCQYVIVCENEISFLSLPKLPSCIGIFGSGYGFSALGQAQWLRSKKIIYWGDLDTHGLAILSEFRKTMFPCKVDSILMDFDTLNKYKQYCVEEPKARNNELMSLNENESLAYRALVENKIGKEIGLEHVRLEQEFIPWDEVTDILRKRIGELL